MNDQVDPRTGVHRVRKKKPKDGKEGEADLDYSQEQPYGDPNAQQYVADMEGGSSRVAYPPPYPPPQ